MFLVTAIAGIPSAISEMVAYYNGIDQCEVGRRLYHSGMCVAMAMDVVYTTMMVSGTRLTDNRNPNVIPVIRSLAWAILIIPGVSITQGFLQGYNWMTSSAISQFVGRFFRVIYMLAITYFITRVQNGDWVSTISQSTFTTFIGAAGAVIVLGIAWICHQREMNDLAA